MNTVGIHPNDPMAIELICEFINNAQSVNAETTEHQNKGMVSPTYGVVYPSSVTGLQTKQTRDGVLISWDAPTFKGFGYTQIERIEGSNPRIIARTSTNQFMDYNAPKSVSYTYKLRHVGLDSFGGQLGDVATSQNIALSSADIIKNSSHCITSDKTHTFNVSDEGVYVVINGMFVGMASLSSGTTLKSNAITLDVFVDSVKTQTITPTVLDAVMPDYKRYSTFLAFSQAFNSGAHTIEIKPKHIETDVSKQAPFEFCYSVLEVSL